MKSVLVIIAIATSFASCCQTFSDRSILGEELLKKELDETLKNKSLHNVIDGRREIIEDKETAVLLAEKFLFRIYGEEKIKDERPYEIFKFGRYWTMRGTLPKNSLGGTFLIIIDATDSKVIRITHDQ